MLGWLERWIDRMGPGTPYADDGKRAAEEMEAYRRYLDKLEATYWKARSQTPAGHDQPDWV